MNNQKTGLAFELQAMQILANSSYGLTFTQEISNEQKEAQFKRYMELRKKYRENKQKEERFLGFRRIPGSYNQNWRLDEV